MVPHPTPLPKPHPQALLLPLCPSPVAEGDRCQRVRGVGGAGDPRSSPLGPRQPPPSRLRARWSLRGCSGELDGMQEP